MRSAISIGIAATLLATAAEAAQKEGFKPLFNGKDLTGWTTEGHWVVEDGVLALKPREGEKGWKRYEDYLWTKKKYEDFVLTAEFKLPEGGNSGLFFRVEDRSDPVKTGIEAQILDSHGKKDLSAHDCGGIISAAAPKKNMAKPAGEWNRMVVTCKGKWITVELNGERVARVNQEKSPLKNRPRKGYIGLQDHGLSLWFRDVRIKRLD